MSSPTRSVRPLQMTERNGGSSRPWCFRSSNEERCKAAKSTLEGSLKEAGAKLKSGLEDLKSIGKADPAQIIIAFNVECLPK